MKRQGIAFAGIALLVGACTTVGADQSDQPVDSTTTVAATAAPSEPAPAALLAAEPAPAPTSSQPVTTDTAPPSEVEVPSGAADRRSSASSTLTTPQSPPTTEALIGPVFTDPAAIPTPVEIFEPTTAQIFNVVVGATETEATITFAANGNGKIDWYSQVLPPGPPAYTYHGKGSSIDITLTIPNTEEARSYLITADGKNPNVGEDSITILLTRGS